MTERPTLNKQLDSNTFLNYYYLKEELTAFCRENEIPTFGSKEELTKRIVSFLDTGKVKKEKAISKKKARIGTIDTDTVIEENFVCSEKHRAFFKEHIGESFTFNVAFQKWLKANTGKTYQEAIEAYGEILKNKKNKKTTIDKQFEYNTYIRAFFEDNTDKSLEEAIKCWKYKKQQQGHNGYEKSDLIALQM